MADINEFLPDVDLEKKSNMEITTAYIKEAMNSTERIFPKRWGIDFYHTYKDDLKLLAELGLKHFGLLSTGQEFFQTEMSWSRMKRVCSFMTIYLMK